MRHILARSQHDVLGRLSRSHALLAFDFDGTLAPIRRDREQARMAAATRALLTELAELYPCLVISGRARDDVQRRVAGVPLRGVLGNHGLEPGFTSVDFRRRVARWSTALTPALARLQGVEIEDKVYSLSVHYRRARRKRAARSAIVRALSGLDDARIVGGKQLLNVIPAGAPHKGVAVLRECERLGCDMALYAGDDETDEDVFALDGRRMLTVRVGVSRSSHAAYFVKGRAEVDRLLERLIRLRGDESPRARRPA